MEYDLKDCEECVYYEDCNQSVDIEGQAIEILYCSYFMSHDDYDEEQAGDMGD